MRDNLLSASQERVNRGCKPLLQAGSRRIRGTVSSDKPDKTPLRFEDVYPIPRSGCRPAADTKAPEDAHVPDDPSAGGLKGDLTNIDLYCLHCGYNLRGLSGDPRRCPECGKLSPISEMTLSAQAITAQLRRMETWPTACIGCVLLLMLSLTLAVLALVVVGPTREVCAGLTLPVLILVPLWYYAAGRFSAACMDRPGWSQVLMEYHIYGIALCLVMVVSFGLPLSYVLQDLGRDPPRSILLTGLAILIGGFTAVIVLAPLARRRCKAKMDALQRDVAVKLAGEYLRRRLSRARR